MHASIMETAAPCHLLYISSASPRPRSCNKKLLLHQRPPPPPAARSTAEAACPACPGQPASDHGHAAPPEPPRAGASPRAGDAAAAGHGADAGGVVGGGAREVLKTHDAACCSRPDTPGARRLSYDHKDVAFTPYSDCWREMRKLFVVELLSMRRVQAAWYAREAQVYLVRCTIPSNIYCCKIHSMRMHINIIKIREVFYVKI
ncbi:hypothetical protein SEVIR_9G011275v4 [Setaria viridis]